ncbi:MAG: ATP-dependent Clp protease proteolytic subunit [Chloroflexi bacterium]|nr:ATP-dependent Clp protease proteolytic subunit [Chloroflexota bacterium]
MIRLEDEPTENEERKEKQPSPFERLMETRTVTIFGEINMKMAQEVTQKLLLLAADSDELVKIFINSPGGHVESGDTIFDMIRFIKPDVKVIGTGWVASAGALIFAAVDTENRLSLPNTRFLLHQPAGGAMGQASDIAIEASEIIKMRRRLNQIFADQTGQSLEKVEKDTDRNFWMSASEAVDYGLVGKIIESVDEIE